MIKDLQQNDLIICDIQSEIFSDSLSLDCSSPVFIRRFMYSDLARRMDDPYFAYGSYNANWAFDEINEEYGGAIAYGQIKYSREELHWIGYIYRYWALAYNKSSKSIYKICPPSRLRDLYYAYHTLDPLAAIDRILEARDVKPDEDMIAKGVILLREIRKGNLKKKRKRTAV